MASQTARPAPATPRPPRPAAARAAVTEHPIYAGDAPGASPIGAELRIVEWQNELIVRGAYPFTYHSPDPVLRELRERYRLDGVVGGARTEFEQMLLIREWVHTRWRHGWSTPPSRSALDLLAAAEAGSEFACGYYATTLVQCLLALGFVARLVSISKTATEWMADEEGNIGHAEMEVWSHQFHKWVLLDADLNCHYERDGVPLSALEIHRAWVERRWDQIRMVQGPTPFRMTDRSSCGFCVGRSVDDHWGAIWTFTRHQVGDYFAHLMLPLRNTQHLTEEAGPTLEWVDELTPPRLVRYGTPAEHDAIVWTSSAADFEWTVDQVQIGLRADPQEWAAGRAVLRVDLDHSTPNLAKLLVRLDTEVWQETGTGFRWPLRPGRNQIMAKPVNAFGCEGHTSRVLLRYHP
jgi:hypothetical protein